MKKYLLLVTTLVLTIIIFILLVYLEKKAVKQEEYTNAFVVNADIPAYSDLTLQQLDMISIAHLENYDKVYLQDLEQVQDMVLTRDYKVGEIVYLKDVQSKDNLENLISESLMEEIALPINNIDSILFNVITSNRYINVYVSVKKEYLPSNIDKYITQYDKDRNVTIFKYLEKIKPIKYCNKDGQENMNSKINSVIISVSKEEAIYLNYIKEIAEFNISVI